MIGSLVGVGLGAPVGRPLARLRSAYAALDFLGDFVAAAVRHFHCDYCHSPLAVDCDSWRYYSFFFFEYVCFNLFLFRIKDKYEGKDKDTHAKKYM